MANPWDKRKGEPNRAYAAFCVYRDLGPDRSVDKAHALLKGGRIAAGRAQGQWWEWSSDFEWVSRAIAFDEHKDQIRLREFEARFKQQARDQADFAFDEFRRLVRRVQKADAILDKADTHPVTDLEQETVDRDGATKRTKVKGINFAGYAALMKEIRESAKRAILGPRDDEEKSDSGAGGTPNLVIQGPSERSAGEDSCG